MGDVAVELQIYPDGPETDLVYIKGKTDEILNKFSKIKKFNIEEKPIAFGLRMLEIIIVMPDSAGGTDDIENRLREIGGVASVEVGETTLI
jgi:translation elongation factor aEF-1 beta